MTNRYSTTPNNTYSFAVGFNYTNAFHIDNVTDFFNENPDSQTTVWYFTSFEDADNAVNEHNSNNN
jgi:hypothetical protein